MASGPRWDPENGIWVLFSIPWLRISGTTPRNADCFGLWIACGPGQGFWFDFEIEVYDWYLSFGFWRTNSGKPRDLITIGKHRMHRKYEALYWQCRTCFPGVLQDLHAVSRRARIEEEPT